MKTAPVTDEPTATNAPLSGLHVLDLSRVLAGPAAARLLTDMGAEVIKVEPPDSDVSRYIAPKSDRGMSGLYTMCNVGKRNVCIDLRTPGGSEVFLDLIRWSHAVIENFRPGVLDKLDLGWETIHRANPRTVLVSLNGYGSRSSWSDRSAYAPTVHAAAGVLHYQSEWTGLPLRQLADNQADMATSLHGTIALLAALRATDSSGRGQHVEVPLFDALLATYSETPFALLDRPAHRQENRLFDAGAHGFLSIAGPPQNTWHRLKVTYGLEDPAPEGADIPTKARLRHDAMERWIQEQPDLETIVARIDTAGLAMARVETLRGALTGPLAKERDLLQYVDDRRGGTRPVVRSPYRFNGSTCPVRGPAPFRGEHNEEILREVLGYGEERIRDLEAEGAILAATGEEPQGPERVDRL